MEVDRCELAGWGRTAPSTATLVRTTAADLLREGLRTVVGDERGAIARGLGRSYGDPAQNGGGTVIELSPGPDPIRLDPDLGVVHADAGVSFDTLLRHIVPKGWFVPVTPGTRFITVGGAVASDIHGKGHHADGSFGAHLEQMTMVLADGAERTITPHSDPDLWWATIGGMGLTGLITKVSFRVIPIETRHFVVETKRVANFDTLVDEMEANDERHRYSVAWIDLVATGRSLGRSVLSMGDHATLDQLAEFDPRAARTPLDFDPTVFPDVPRGVPNVLTRAAVRAFNEFWYRKTPRFHRGTESITQFFHPLDMVGQWTRLYGRHGFLQYQFVVPFDAVDTMRTIVSRIAGEGHASFLAVLKRLGAESGGHLSFPRPGWTLTLDLPAGVDGLDRFLADLDDLVLGVGGRHYLAKDAFATPEVVRQGYPRLDDWKAVRATVDPDGLWVSDQARRLELV